MCGDVRDFDRREDAAPDDTAAWTGHDSDVQELIHALTLFMLAHLELADCADRDLQPLQMHRTHHRILHICARRPGHTVGDIVRILRLTLQAVQAPMRDLIRNGWIEQRRSATDKRQRLLYLTSRGREMHGRLVNKQFRLLMDARNKVGERAFAGFLATSRALSRPSDLLLFDEEAPVRRQAGKAVAKAK